MKPSYLPILEDFCWPHFINAETLMILLFRLTMRFPSTCLTRNNGTSRCKRWELQLPSVAVFAPQRQVSVMCLGRASSSGEGIFSFRTPGCLLEVQYCTITRIVANIKLHSLFLIHWISSRHPMEAPLAERRRDEDSRRRASANGEGWTECDCIVWMNEC